MTVAAPKTRSRRFRVCTTVLLFGLAIQALVFCYLQISIGTRHHSAPSAVLANNLEYFLGSSVSNSKVNDTSKVNLALDTSEKAIEAKDADADESIKALSSSALQQHDATSNIAIHSKSKRSRNIPNWLKEYIAWHKEQRKGLTIDNWNKDGRKYLIAQCLEIDNRCGGTADRLKPTPTLLLLAHQFQRILLIRWERPCALEEFLLPPPNGLDWRVPEWMAPKLGEKPFGMSVRQLRFRLKTHNGRDVVVRSRYQSYNGGADYYNEQFNNTNEHTFEEAYHDIWHSIFTPAPPLQEEIDSSLNQLSLVPGEYAAAHLRALYAVDSRPRRIIEQAAINAVNCASQLRPGGPVFFATDSTVAVETVQKYAKSTNRNIIFLIHDQEPLHLEKANHTNRRASEYYATFVDLYLLGNSRCLAYNVGGFGTWGLLMGYNSSCGMLHSSRSLQNLTQCEWTD